MSLLKRRWWLVGLMVLAAMGLWRLRFDVEVLNLLPRGLAEVRGLALYNEHFENARELIVSVDAGDPARAQATAQAVARTLRGDTQRVAAVYWQPPWQEHPEDAAAMLAYTWINQPPAHFRELTQRLEPDRLNRILRSARERLSTTLSPGEFAALGFDPLGFTDVPGPADNNPVFGRGDELFASEDGSFRILFVQATGDLADYRECASWFQSIRSQVDAVVGSLDETSPVSIGYTGRPAFVSEISGGMRSDMTRSVLGTGLIVAGLFWWSHRRFKPMGWLMLLMATAIGLTLAFGGLLYGPLNVISVGFAAILLGLAADYGMVLYQEWREAPAHGPRTQVGSARRGVRWSALTTACAFLMLNLSGLPGLGQLGTLVAIGVLFGAALMLRLYLAPFQHENPAGETEGASDGHARGTPPVPRGSSAPSAWPTDRRLTVAALVVTPLLLAGALALLRTGWPPLNPSADALRPSESPAYTALAEIEARMRRGDASLWLILAGRNESDVAGLLDENQAALEAARAAGSIERFTLPGTLYPRPGNQSANRGPARALVARWPDLRQHVLAAGFTTNALALADGVMNGLEEQSQADSPWPENAVATWSLGRFTARTPTNHLVMGLVYPAPDGAGVLPALPGQREGVAWLVGWQRLGRALVDLVRRDLARVFIPTLLVVGLCLGLAFRRGLEVLLALGALGFSLLMLAGLMKVAGWSWNLLNLMALPLLLGVGIDYSIHTMLALRRYDGDLAKTRRSVGRALFLCAASTAAAFGSLGFSNNAGLASLGRVCASGVGISYLVATLLLPGWWRCAVRRTGSTRRTAPGAGGVPASKPSALYGARGWRTGLWLGRRLPYPLLLLVARVAALLYRRVARHRYDVVTANLRPMFQSDAETEATADRLFSQFARKLVDLWRYESGASIEPLFGDLQGLEHLLAARAPGRGLLLVTPHLGNWEFGAPLMTRQGVTVQVVTLAEPDERLTALRSASRARWNIETVVIGSDPFGFVELIRRLEDGATVALLVDRPAAATATPVTLFNRIFQASSAPAELARATGCAILPVYVVRANGHYNATALPSVEYDRAALRAPAARHELTQKILRAFEPAIRQHADQWYHFVPIWPPTPLEPHPGHSS